MARAVSWTVSPLVLQVNTWRKLAMQRQMHAGRRCELRRTYPGRDGAGEEENRRGAGEWEADELRLMSERGRTLTVKLPKVDCSSLKG